MHEPLSLSLFYKYQYFYFFPNHNNLLIQDVMRVYHLHPLLHFLLILHKLDKKNLIYTLILQDYSIDNYNQDNATKLEDFRMNCIVFRIYAINTVLFIDPNSHESRYFSNFPSITFTFTS